MTEFYFANNLDLQELHLSNVGMVYTEAVAQRCSLRKGVLRNFAKFTGEHLCKSLFFNKVAG